VKVDLAKVRALVEEGRSRAAAAQLGTPPRLGNRSWFRIENRPAAMEGGPTTDIYLYDAIGEWGVTAQDFVDALRSVVTGTITMYVNCEGGEVFDGLAIYEALRRHPASITAFIDGIAASAASFVVCAANRVVIAEHGRMMIHDAHGLAMGNARDMRSMADLLDSLSDTIADIYAERTRGTRDDWRAAMQAAEGGPDGTWYDARAAVKAKLADEMIGGDKPGNLLPTPPALADRQAAEFKAAWNAGAFLATIDEISNPVEPVELPTGPALFAGLFDR
jgi:ATP-dependent protease ClpP protease subunit